MAETSYDLIVTGAGTGGIIMAARIAQKGVHPTTGEHLKVALLDLGPYFEGTPRPGYGVPRRRHMFTNVRSDFQGRYRTQRGMPPGASRRVPLGPDDETYTFNTAGIVGGGSVLYTAITNTPYEADYQVWSDETGLDLSYQNLKYAAEETERAFNIHTKPDGLLRVGDRLFRDSARALGIEVNPAKIAKQNCLWCGYCDGVNMCKYDARGGSFTGYLPTALEHGVEIIPDAKAEKVLIEKQGTGFGVTGVAYLRNGEREVVNAPRVVVSCGQYGSTPLLLRSGYGPRRLVEQLIVENPNVGDHTDARPWCERMTAVFDQPISDGQYRDGNVVGAFYAYHDTRPDKQYDRIQITMAPKELPGPERAAISSDAPEFGWSHKEYMRNLVDRNNPTKAQRDLLSRMAVDVRVIRPSSVRGYINEWGEMVYRANDPTILKPIQEGREVAYEILKKMGAKEVLGIERPARVFAVEKYVGACQPGADPKRSVVDGSFESHDIPGLFVCDGSTVPLGASEGYAGSVGTVAVYASDRIVERHFKRG